MKTVITFLAIVFISFQTVAQSESDESSPSTTTTKKTKVDTNDLATQIMNKINACEDMTCFVNFYNRFAKVTSDFSNRKSGVSIMVEILKLMDKKKPGLLFDVYMKANSKYQPYFIECAKLLPSDLRNEIARKAKNYAK